MIQFSSDKQKWKSFSTRNVASVLQEHFTNLGKITTNLKYKIIKFAVSFGFKDAHCITLYHWTIKEVGKGKQTFKYMQKTEKSSVWRKSTENIDLVLTK